MIKTEIKQQIITDYKNGISLRKTAAKNKVSLDTVYKLTRKLIKIPKQVLNPKDTIYNNIYNNISTLNALSTKEKERDKEKEINIPIQVFSKEDNKNNIKDIKENKSNETVKDTLKDNETVITPKVENKSEDHKQLKVINSSINKILKELKGIDYNKEKLKDLTTSLNALNKQKQDITGTASSNNSIIQQIFNSPDQVSALLKEIQESKKNPEAYIVKQQAQQEAI
jgi:predicted RND superfamily exporter protein